MRCRASAKGANDYYDEHYDDYIPARDEEFKDQVLNEMESYLANIDEESTPSFADFFEIFQNEFTFPDVGEWLGSEYEGMLGDCADQAMEEARERAWEDKE